MFYLLNPIYAAEPPVPVEIESKLGPLGYFGDLVTLFMAVLGFALAASGVVFFFMLVWGGFRFMTARGDDKALAGARGTLTSAIIGLLIIISVLIIFNIVRFTFTGT